MRIFSFWPILLLLIFLSWNLSAASPNPAARPILGKWLNVEGQRIWEFSESRPTAGDLAEGQLLNYSLHSNGGAPAPIPFRITARQLWIFSDPQQPLQLDILEIDANKMRLYDKDKDQTFHFVHLRTQYQGQQLNRWLENQSFQHQNPRKDAIRVFAFGKKGRWHRIVGREMKRMTEPWSVQNLQGFHFLTLNQQLAYLLIPLNRDTLLMGQLQEEWRLEVYERIRMDYADLQQTLTGKWIFRINYAYAPPTLKVRLKKDGSGTWQSLHQKKKIPIRWTIRNGAPLLHIYQNGNRNADYLILKAQADQLMLEELNTADYRKGKWIMYGTPRG